MKIRMTYGFVLTAAARIMEANGFRMLSWSDLVAFANTVDGRELFPEGLTFEQAQYMFKHQDEMVPKE